MNCNLIRIRQTSAMEEGAGARVRRLFPVAGCRNHDPFVLWDHFEIAPGSGFPAHPHRGFEAITYLFEGAMEHADNLGNRSTNPDGKLKSGAPLEYLGTVQRTGKTRSDDVRSDDRRILVLYRNPGNHSRDL